MIPVYEQFSVGDIGKGVERVAVSVCDLESSLVQCQAWYKLPEHTNTGQCTGRHGNPDRHFSKELPSRGFFHLLYIHDYG
jgi:hypothetical protein